MEDNFDYHRYVDAIHQFLFDTTYLADDRDPQISVSVRPVAEILRIGKVEAVVYENADFEKKEPWHTLLLHDSEECDSERVMYTREVLGNGNVVHNNFYQIKGDPDWNDADNVRLTAFEKLLTVFEERFKMKQVVSYFMNNDAQLNVRNVRYMMNKLGELSARHMLSEFGMCHFNLRQFSLVNEYIGRHNGTTVMYKYTRVLLNTFSDKDETLCRMGGDNFALLFKKEKADALRKLLDGVTIQSDSGEFNPVTVSATAGIYMIPDGPLLSTDVMDRSSIACKAAKTNRASPVVYFDEQMQYASDNAKRVQALFPKAISGEEFQVYYQPKVHLQDYTLAGAEALCRWIRDKEFITPDKFIPVFESKGLIAELDFYMLAHVCRDIRRWLDSSKRVVPVSVNISRCHFEDSMLFEHIMEIIDRYGIPREYIEIELTESTADVDFGYLKDFITRLRAEGVSVSVDDFGTGYSSLNLISELPWDFIKLDKSLLHNEDNGGHSKVMLSHIIYMAKELGIKCICEGVENAEHIQLLKESSCLIAQGFYFDRPLPVSVFETRLDSKRIMPADRK